jgi:hypothetical protein
MLPWQLWISPHKRAYRHELPDCRYSETDLSLVYPDRDHSAGSMDRPA